MQKTALLVVDVQKGMDTPGWGARNNPGAEDNIAALLKAFRKAGGQVVHVQHLSTEPDSPFRPGSPGCEFKPEGRPLPGEVVFQKNANSAFIGTGLEAWLRGHKLHKLVVAGFTTEHCVSSTVRMAGNLGFDVTLAHDATAAFENRDLDGMIIPPGEIHRIHLASLNGEFCSLAETRRILKKLH